jgi:putative ABC transport system permease protein
LAIVIGANTTIFGAIHAVLLRPFVIYQPDDLVVAWGSDPSRSLPVLELSYQNFEDWSAHSRSFTHLAALGSSTWPTVVDTAGESTRVASPGVSSSFFSTLGVLPLHGRDFRPDDDEPNVPLVAIVSHRLWVQRLGADPDAIGRTLSLDDRPHTIVGIMPDGFDFPRGTEVWTPVVPVLTKDWGIEALEQVGALFVVGRLRAGTTSTIAAQELQRLVGSAQRSSRPPRIVVTPLLDVVLGPARQGLWALLAAVGILLLIGCANLSGLMLIRVTARRREHAVQVALGGTPVTLARRWTVEALLLSLAGGVLGLFASYALARLIVGLAPDIPRLADLAINRPVMVFTFGVILTTTLLCALAPMRFIGRGSLLTALHESARSTSNPQTRRTQSLLLTGQLALSVVLLIGAGLILRSFDHLRSIDLGFRPTNLLTMTVEPRGASAPNAWMDELIARVSSITGVEAVGAVYLRPLAFGPIGQETWVVLEGQLDDADAAQQNPQLDYQVATPGYFAAMGIQLRQGRLFSDEDTAQSPRVALVSETTARRLWPGADPIDKRLLLPSFAPNEPSSEWRTVVGVVSDVRYRGLDDVRLDVYDLAAQASMGVKDFVIRTSGDPLNVLEAVRTEARRLDSRVVVDRVTTMETVLSQALAPWRLSAWLLAGFSGIAVVLVIVGLFSAVSLDLGQRQRELAVRRALGAQRADILRPILRSALLRALIGITVGTMAALGLTDGLASLLVGVDALDLRTHGAVIGLVLLTVGLASWLPAYRATKVDPMVALRCE